MLESVFQIRTLEEVRYFVDKLKNVAMIRMCEALGVEPPCPESMLGTMASVPLPRGGPPLAESALYRDPLQDVLLDRWGIEVPVHPWPAPPQRLIRVSAQLYNEAAQYERLAAALRQVFR